MSETNETQPKPRAISVRETTYQMITEEARRRGVSRALLVRLAIESFTARNPLKETRA